MFTQIYSIDLAFCSINSQILLFILLSTELSRAQNRQAMSRIEAALEAASKMEVQPAALRTDEGIKKPHPLVAALMAGGVKRQHQQSDKYRRGRNDGGGSNFHRFHPYLRR